MLASHDAGRNWQKDDSGSIAFPYLYLWHHPFSLAVGAEHSVYSANARGIFKSLDGGETWAKVSITMPKGLTEALLDPLDPNICYALVDRGLFKTTNGGKTWNLLASGFPGPNVRALVTDPNHPSTLYVGTFGRGVFKSTNGGQDWKPTGSRQ
jgi:photosystem II stability/assembly factor-like uncharacterized protein